MTNRQPVASGAIATVGYEESAATLEIEFKDGQVWRYSPVSGMQYREMLTASSIGEYFNRNIRDSARFRVRVD